MDFEVVPASVPYWLEERERALAAPVEELPELTEFERAKVRRSKADEERYRRLHPLLARYVLERQRRQGIEFGQWIEEILRPLGAGYRLLSVRRTGRPDAWRVSIHSDERGLVEFSCLVETVDAMTEHTASATDIDTLRLNILEVLEEAHRLGATG